MYGPAAPWGRPLGPRLSQPNMAKRKTKAAKAAEEAEEPEDPNAEPPVGLGRSLVIVESPAKAKTINKYLGASYVVRASMGHVRDLPKGRFGIQVDKGFEPDYVTITGKTKVITELRKLAKAAPAIYLAPDPDREGEAIAWHLSESLGVDPKRMHRVVFNEITEKAVKAAFTHPRSEERRVGKECRSRWSADH